MATLRDLVTGSDVCTPSDGAGPSNAAATFVNTLLGGRSKQQEQIHELPGALGRPGPSISSGPTPFQPPTAEQAADAAFRANLPAIPGFQTHSLDVDTFLRQQQQQQQQQQSAGIVDEFVRDFEALHQTPPLPLPPPVLQQRHQQQHSAVQPFLHAFFHSSNETIPPILSLDLTVPDKCHVRDRSTILARQVFADRGNAYADQQVGRLLRSLNIDPAVLPSSTTPLSGPAQLPQQQQLQEWDRLFHSGASSTSFSTAGDHAAAMANRNNYTTLSLSSTKDQQAASPWVDEFESKLHLESNAKHGTNQWANEFNDLQQEKQKQQHQQQTSAVEQTRKLADILSSNTDPKFQNSKFLQFVSKMSRGELILEDNGVKEVGHGGQQSQPQWVEEYQNQTQGARDMWGVEFASFQAARHPHLITQNQHSKNVIEGQDWADEFASSEADVSANQWAQEFIESTTNGAMNNWEEEYLQELERLHNPEYGPIASSGNYVMAENNPFLSDVNSFAKGRELFKNGVLTEAVLALEAECQRNPGNSEAWRLLGTVQAENDDDVQAIAALNRALAADPDDLDALLSLGVSHTNELEQSQALGYLREWVMRHPVHGHGAKQTPGPPDSSQAMAYVISLYETAAREAPHDADVHAALGVLCNLARRYSDAVNAFQAALKIRPQDYSLWNKLGATLANSAQSSEALSAYQKALDLKPNYMRAWTNMGISLANIGDYDTSARYYVRALVLNRKAAAVWGYLRTSLSCASHEDLLHAAEIEDLDTLLKALPL